ncbi:hypothetical protein TRFO_28954 [Tritrichomonas foetus]|uniref:E3 ubiquitin-protein ligase listerin n=1 Tax=Tritrichomonas foetus TaxID=1144522 RepID=A0A1J4K2B1_9EUKA|nr:hypothetical protein TRFO_28954 [Tritrichomonas foetus]|eukprot:OHT03629.1 hypothetical protein TRFO_28954 [Tritrichomonas foetus]
MDLTHKAPFPDFDSLHSLFLSPQVNSLLNDCRIKNVNRISTALNKLSSLVPKFSETENYAAFIAARNTMQNSSQKVRFESMHLFVALSKTSLCIHTVPYLLLLTHDDYPQLKTEAAQNFTKLLKEIGGLRQCLRQLIPAIGSMGAIAFSYVNSSNADELMSNSRLASCVVLAATQLLSLLFKDISRGSCAELIQYIKIAIEGVRSTLALKQDSLKTLFFNQRLRCCLYRLQQETEKIQGCPKFVFSDFLNEKDPQCIKYVSVLMKTAEIEWPDLVKNPLLLNEFIDGFLSNCEMKKLSEAFQFLNEENKLKAISLLIEKDAFKLIDFTDLSKIPHIWEKLPENVLKETILACNMVDAKFVIQFSKYFETIPNKFKLVSESSDPEEVSEAFNLIGTPDEIPDFLQKFPKSILSTIRKWEKSPKTDFYIPYFDFDYYIFSEANTIFKIIPNDKIDEFTEKVDNLIKDLILSDDSIPSSLWNFTSLPDELCRLIIEKHVEIETDKETKEKLYEKVFKIIEETQNEANAGAMIGKIASSAKVRTLKSTHSYDFMQNYFNEVEIDEAPIEMEIEFLEGYIFKELPNFEVVILNSTSSNNTSSNSSSVFEFEKMLNSVSRFLEKLTPERREEIVKEAAKMKIYSVALFLISTTKSILDVPPIEYFIPFLAKNSIYSTYFHDWLNKFDQDSIFVKFIQDPENSEVCQTLQKDHPLFLFATSESHQFPASLIYEVSSEVIENVNTLQFYLILKSLLNVSFLEEKFTDMLFNLLSVIPSLPPLNSQVHSLLEDFFSFSLKIDDKQKLFDLLSNISILLSVDVLGCLKKTILVYLNKINICEWPQLRKCFDRGPASSLSCLDDFVAQKFNDYIILDKTIQNFNDMNELKELFNSSLNEKFLFLLENFPNAASKWFATKVFQKNSEKIIKEKVIKDFSYNFIPKLIEKTVNEVKSSEMEINLGQLEKSNTRTINCSINRDDDTFRLTVKIPETFPIEPYVIEIKSIGKDSVTRDTRDEVIREALRPGGLTCAILAWRAKILSIVNNENPCPICLSLLDERGDMPKARCPTCHQSCHASCMKQWMSNSIKKICPWCRALWKQPRHRPKKAAATHSSPI